MRLSHAWAVTIIVIIILLLLLVVVEEWERDLGRVSNAEFSLSAVGWSGSDRYNLLSESVAVACGTGSPRVGTRRSPPTLFHLSIMEVLDAWAATCRLFTTPTCLVVLQDRCFAQWEVPRKRADGHRHHQFTTRWWVLRLPPTLPAPLSHEPQGAEADGR